MSETKHKIKTIYCKLRGKKPCNEVAKILLHGQEFCFLNGRSVVK